MGHHYKSLIPEAIGNFAFDFGGMLEFPIVVSVTTENPDVTVVLAAIQLTLMATFSVCMTIAGGIYLFVPGQTHVAQ